MIKALIKNIIIKIGKNICNSRINHNGDMNIAKKLISLAKNSGCDAVNFKREI